MGIVLAVFFALFLAGIVTGNFYLIAPLVALGIAAGVAEWLAPGRDEG
jgi:hypothetical protein